jgi:hypothetical protein
MDVPPVASPAYDRLKRAAYGFGVTVALLAAIACVQLLVARQTVIEVGGMDPDVNTWAVSYFQSTLIAFYAVVGSFVIAYWLLMATLERGQFLGIRSANVTLALSGVTFTLAMFIASVVRAPAQFLEDVFPFLGLSNTNAPFGCDTQSSCEAFATTATPLCCSGCQLFCSLQAHSSAYSCRATGGDLKFANHSIPTPGGWLNV